MAALPEVSAVHEALFGYSALGPGTGYVIDAVGSVGTEIQRATLLEGRWLDSEEAAEAVISLALARRDGLEVGDSFELFPEEYLSFDDSPEGEVFAQRLLAAVPDLRMRVVGVVIAPAQVPPVPEIGLPLMQLSPALAEVLPLESSVLLVDLASESTPADLRERCRRARAMPGAPVTSSSSTWSRSATRLSARCGRRSSPCACSPVPCCSPPW